MTLLKRFFILTLALLLVLVPMTACSDEGGTQEEITVTVKVIHKDKTEKTFTIETTATTLLGALQQEGIVEGEDQTAGFYITAVDGETADWSVDQGWWCFTKGGAMLMTGAESTKIADGDCYEITYTIG